jgi:hypothetical protein
MNEGAFDRFPGSLVCDGEFFCHAGAAAEGPCQTRISFGANGLPQFDASSASKGAAEVQSFFASREKNFAQTPQPQCRRVRRPDRGSAEPS